AVASGLRDVGIAASAAGDLDRAELLFDEALALGREHDYPDLAVVAYRRARLEATRGNIAAFRERGREAVAIAEALGDAGMVIDATLCIGIAYVIESRWAEAQPLLLEALEGALRRRRLSIPRLPSPLAAV